MNSLKIKFLGLCCIILLVAIGLTTWYNLQTQKVMLNKLATDHGRMLAETIRSSIITDMANGKNDQVFHILEKINAEPAINNVRIFDETGRILISANPEEIDTLVTTSELMAYRSGRNSFTSNHPGLPDFSNSVVPIFNQPACYSCHDQEIEVLGILNLQVSLDAISSMKRTVRNATMVASGVMLFILILAISGFLLVYVDAPIQKLVNAMDHVEQGHFDKAITSVNSSHEMTLLSTKFNYMVHRLRELLETTIRSERELAVSQEKLVHNEQLTQMNTTLEERLKEIEYLNINLEERIEEIEEANYKIADLASELEDKNFVLSQAVDRLQALYAMGLAVNATMDLDTLLNLLSRKTRETLKAQVVYILMKNCNPDNLIIKAADGLSEKFDFNQEIPLRPGGVSNWVIEHNKPKLIEDIDQNREFNRMSRHGFVRESVICAPLRDKGNVIGTITVANSLNGDRFGQSDLELLSTIAAQASVAIRNATLYEERETAYLNTVQALVSTIEASDAYTRGHSERVTKFCLVLAKKMGIQGEALKHLEQAAILHDIGKIGINIGLLNKKDKLTSDDIETLKQHPTIGVRILEPVHFFGTVRKIIEQHHERFDGTGYPNQLSGKDWCLEGKILAICDAFDAMTSDRPYRKALPEEVAIKEILDHSGTQFDPVVATTFVNLYRNGQLPF